MNELFEARCLCYAREARQHEPEVYQWSGGILWAWWSECPAHPGERHTAPVWTRQDGQLRYDEAETVDVVSAPV